MAFADRVSPTTWESFFDDASDSESQSDQPCIPYTQPLASESVIAPTKIDLFDTLFTPDYYSRLENPLSGYIMDSPIFQHNLFPEDEKVEPKPYQDASREHDLSSQPPFCGYPNDLPRNVNNIGYNDQGSIAPQATLLRPEKPWPQVLPRWTMPNPPPPTVPAHLQHGGQHPNAIYAPPLPSVPVDLVIQNNKRDEFLAVSNSANPRATRPPTQAPPPSGHTPCYSVVDVNVPPRISASGPSRTSTQRGPPASPLTRPPQSMYSRGPTRLRKQKSQNSMGSSQQFSPRREERTRTGRAVKLPSRYLDGEVYI